MNKCADLSYRIKDSRACLIVCCVNKSDIRIVFKSLLYNSKVRSLVYRELEVDVSALGPDEYGKFPLISAASLTGEFDPSKVSVTGGASDGKLVWRTTASGTELCYHRPRVTLLILR